jgi:hypothetical protein
MARGAEAYLQMWERAVGVPGPSSLAASGRFTRQGLGRLRLGLTSGQLLRQAGQPKSRPGRAWSWSVKGKANGDAKTVAVLSPEGRVALVASTARGHRARGVGHGAKASRLRPTARGSRLRVRPAGGGKRFVYGVRRGRVRFVAVASRQVASSSKRLRAHLRLAGLR